jgi:16S rRNA (guanine(966)-N(2))-methyltransferase RsmD
MIEPMRIIAGDKKGAVLKSPPGEATRPTLGLVRESMFGMLAQLIPGASVTDLFAGSGSLGLEALSRGAERCLFAENARPALEALKANIAKLGYGKLALIDPRDAIAVARKADLGDSQQIIFSDPPYGRGLAQESLIALADNPTLQVGAIVVLQCGARDPVTDDSTPRVKLFRSKTYGETAVHFFEATEDGSVSQSESLT